MNPDERRFRLKRHYSVVAHDADLVELRHGVWNAVSFMLADDSGSGQLLRLVDRLDGQLSNAEIAASEGVPEAQVELLVDQLAQLGAVQDGDEHALDYYLDHVIPNLAPYAERRQARFSAITLIADPPLAHEIERVLAPALGVTVDRAEPDLVELLTNTSGWAQDGLERAETLEAFSPWADQLVVFAASALNPLTLQALNRVSLHHRFPWIHAVADGPFLLVGPTFVPWRSPCYSCLEARVTMNLRESARYQEYKRALATGRASGVTAPLDRVLAAMLGSHVAFEALNFALTGNSFTIGKLLAIYLPTMEFTFNEVLRLPGCPACGPAPESDDRELYFELRAMLDTDGRENGASRR